MRTTIRNSIVYVLVIIIFLILGFFAGLGSIVEEVSKTGKSISAPGSQIGSYVWLFIRVFFKEVARGGIKSIVWLAIIITVIFDLTRDRNNSYIRRGLQRITGLKVPGIIEFSFGEVTGTSQTVPFTFKFPERFFRVTSEVIDLPIPEFHEETKFGLYYQFAYLQLTVDNAKQKHFTWGLNELIRCCLMATQLKEFHLASKFLLEYNIYLNSISEYQWEEYQKIKQTIEVNSVPLVRIYWNLWSLLLEGYLNFSLTEYTNARECFQQISDALRGVSQQDRSFLFCPILYWGAKVFLAKCHQVSQENFPYAENLYEEIITHIPDEKERLIASYEERLAIPEAYPEQHLFINFSKDVTPGILDFFVKASYRGKAFIRFARSQYQDALGILFSLQQQLGTDNWTEYNIAACYHHLNKPSLAITHLNSAVEEDPSDFEMREFFQKYLSAVTTSRS